MRLEIAAISDRGKVRSGNEDNFIVNDEILPEIHNDTVCIRRTVSSADPVLLGVFDGMGGYASGETASFLAASVAKDLQNRNRSPKDPKAHLLEICTQANQAVCEEMLRKGITRMGTTAALLLARGRSYDLCNVGDSPIFLLRRGVLRELSLEHTDRAMYEAVTGEKSDPKRKFYLTQNIGMFADDPILDPYCSRGVLRGKDVFLLCSDGVTDMLTRETLKELLSIPDVQEAAEQIVGQALEAGGRDNITAIVIRCDGGLFRRFGKAEKRKGDLTCGK